MTDAQFSEFSRRLFSAFPDLNEWLSAHSPDPAATLAVWRRCLASYSVEECQSVLDRWSMGELAAPKAYERSQYALHVKATIDHDRSMSRKAEAKQADGDYWRDESDRRRMRRRGEDVQGGIIGALDRADGGRGEMVAALLACRPEHKRMVGGEITRAEYEAIKRSVFVRHGIMTEADARRERAEEARLWPIESE